MKPVRPEMTRHVRLATVVVVGIAAMALQLGVASAGTSRGFGSTGSSEAAARQNFVDNARQACASQGGLKRHRILGVTQQGNQWYAEGTIECNR